MITLGYILIGVTVGWSWGPHSSEIQECINMLGNQYTYFWKKDNDCLVCKNINHKWYTWENCKK